MADDLSGVQRSFSKIKQWVGWSWTYLWGFWFLLVIFLLYVLRTPLRLKENLNLAALFLNTLTPKFYVALTGTSSFISGIILIFEWWYFQKYGTSFIEHVSLSHLAPLLGTSENTPQNNSQQNVAECKVWRNPGNLFRGAEYNRYYWVTGKEPLTYYDMNLSAQDHQTFFTCDSDIESSDLSDELMLRAWRERDQEKRIKIAHQALEHNAKYAEKLFKQALKASETLLRNYTSVNPDTKEEVIHRRDTNVCVYIRRRLAMCARKLGRVKEAIKMMRDLMKEFPLMSVLNIHENLLEALLEIQAYSEMQQVLAKYDGKKLFSPEVAAKRGLSPAEMAAVEAIHRAVEFNPHVPKSLILPPEHILKRGDSEAIAYSFFHLTHWKKVEGALNLLHCTWEGTFRLVPYPLEKGHLFHPYPACTENADRELLPSHHELSIYPKKELPFFILFTAALCSFTAMLALLTHQFPEPMANAAKTFLSWISTPLNLIIQKFEDFFPAHIWHQLTRI
ncbi:Protein ST7-like protein [Acropora cervicornis]|uniref:Protein ST7 homolog n=1 Tax=Acropora cervicornis TaxID=6130 RepID=A0AAD9VB12_ACRCE|nr:Protein ST7-like protein [Acropora cervicornis]